MQNREYKNFDINTPAFVFDIPKLKKTLEFYKGVVQKSGCKQIFPLKTFSVAEILKYMKKYISGFSASSLFEAKLADEILDKEQTLHYTTAGIKQDEFAEISALTDYIAFNSITQYESLKEKLNSRTKIGFRLNPKISAEIDERYNPCCKNSKLGVPLEDFTEYVKNCKTKNISGIHFHTNCDSTDFGLLEKTIDILEKRLELSDFEWINLGGGYLYEEAKNIDVFFKIVEKLKSKYGLTVFVEPGAGVIRNSCSLVTTVLDLFEVDGVKNAILDTSINHLSEMFDYGYRLEITSATKDGGYEYILNGSSCLAGDRFGLYKFDKPLAVGDKITINNVGAYNIVKSNMFNGINMPDMYILDDKDDLKQIKSFGYQDFLNRYR